MGQFSWLDCVTKQQIVDNRWKKVYVLVPKEFGGGHIEENCYDGYGNFGGYDIYDLVADWNREYLSKHPEHVFPHALHRADWFADYVKTHPDYSERIYSRVSDMGWYSTYADLSKSREEVVRFMEENHCGIYPEWRTIGIDIACYDEDNSALPYPIKITYDASAVYEDCNFSPSDPDQGWESYDDEDD